MPSGYFVGDATWIFSTLYLAENQWYQDLCFDAFSLTLFLSEYRFGATLTLGLAHLAF